MYCDEGARVCNAEQGRTTPKEGTVALFAAREIVVAVPRESSPASTHETIKLQTAHTFPPPLAQVLPDRRGRRRHRRGLGLSAGVRGVRQKHAADVCVESEASAGGERSRVVCVSIDILPRGWRRGAVVRLASQRVKAAPLSTAMVGAPIDRAAPSRTHTDPPRHSFSTPTDRAALHRAVIPPPPPPTPSRSPHISHATFVHSDFLGGFIVWCAMLFLPQVRPRAARDGLRADVGGAADQRGRDRGHVRVLAQQLAARDGRARRQPHRELHAGALRSGAPP